MNSTQKVEKPTSVWDRLGQAVTVATVIGFISQVFGSSTRGTALICVVALVVTWIGLYVVEKSPQTREKIYTSRIAPSKIVALVLAAVLGELYYDSIRSTPRFPSIRGKYPIACKGKLSFAQLSSGPIVRIAF